MNKMLERTTHGVVYPGFRGFRAFVARKRVWCKLIGNRSLIPQPTYINNYGSFKQSIQIKYHNN